MPFNNYQRTWRAKRKAEGKCHICFKRQAGGEGGTPVQCPGCAESSRRRALNRLHESRDHRLETSRARQMMALLDKLKYRPGVSL